MTSTFGPTPVPRGPCATPGCTKPHTARSTLCIYHNRRRVIAEMGGSGYKCPKCANPMSVIDTRPTADGHIDRTRKCRNCDHRLTTVEAPRMQQPTYFTSINRSALERVQEEITTVLSRLGQ